MYQKFGNLKKLVEVECGFINFYQLFEENGDIGFSTVDGLGGNFFKMF